MVGDLFSTLQDNKKPSIKQSRGIANCVQVFEQVERWFEIVLAVLASLVELGGFELPTF